MVTIGVIAAAVVLVEAIVWLATVSLLLADEIRDAVRVRRARRGWPRARVHRLGGWLVLLALWGCDTTQPDPEPYRARVEHQTQLLEELYSHVDQLVREVVEARVAAAACWARVSDTRGKLREVVRALAPFYWRLDNDLAEWGQAR